MPTTEPDGFLNDALKTDEDRFRTVVSGDDNFGMTWQHR